MCLDRTVAKAAPVAATGDSASDLQSASVAMRQPRQARGQLGRPHAVAKMMLGVWRQQPVAGRPLPSHSSDAKVSVGPPRYDTEAGAVLFLFRRATAAHGETSSTATALVWRSVGGLGCGGQVFGGLNSFGET